MPRSKGMDGAYMKVRSDLEAVLGALADIDECIPVVTLRINQAIRRTGLDGLLVPARDDLVRVARDVADARAQVMSAVERLIE